MTEHTAKNPPENICRECGRPMDEPGYVHDGCERVEGWPDAV